MHTEISPHAQPGPLPGLTNEAAQSAEQRREPDVNVPPDALDAAYCAWLTAISQQQDDALATFYDATISRVYGVALRITRKPETAEEVVADVYLQVWRNASTYNTARGRVLPWLLTITRSRALDHLRRKDPAEAHPEPESLRPDLDINPNDPLD